MKISSVNIRNFRGIGDEPLNINFKAFNLLIGDNETSKTSILEAINLCLSSSYAASKLGISDFHLGLDGPIEITIIFDKEFEVDIPDGFATQKIVCKGITLSVKKRNRSAPG